MVGAFSSKFPRDQVIRVGSLMLLQTEDGHALQTVMQVNPEGLHLQEFEPGAPSHDVVFHPFGAIFFPIALTAGEMTAGQRIGALYDLQQDPNALSGPDWTTVYYSAVVNRSQKDAVKGVQKAIIYQNSDGPAQVVVPIEAFLPGERQPFPTCVTPLLVTDAHIRLMMDPPPPIEEATSTPETIAPPPPPPAATARAATPSRASVASPAVHGAGSTIKLVVKVKPTAATPPAAVAASPALPPAVADLSSSTAHQAPPAAAAAPPPSAASLAASSSDHLGKRKREESIPPPAAASPNAMDTATSVAAAASAPALSLDAAGAPAKKQKREKKEKKDKSSSAAAAAAAAADEASASWHVDLPADPAIAVLGVKWTLESLSSVIPALNPMIKTEDVIRMEEAKEAAQEGAPAAPAAAAAATAASAVTATPASPSIPPLSTGEADDHPLMKSLELEFANWETLQQSKRADSTSSTPAGAPSTASSALTPSSFLAYRSALGQVHFYDQLKRLSEKQLICAPYLLDYGLDHGLDEARGTR